MSSPFSFFVNLSVILFFLQDLFENIQEGFETDLDMDLESFTQGETEFAGQVKKFSILDIFRIFTYMFLQQVKFLYFLFLSFATLFFFCFNTT